MTNYIVITENDESNWDDQTGVRYHYPPRYKRLIQLGVEVIYYKGKLQDPKFRAKRISDKQHYFGTGRIAEVIKDLNPKILISVKGSNDIRKFITSDEYRTLRGEGVEIYAVASHEEIGNDINGQKVRRQDFLKRLKEDGNDKSKSIIVLHYDILAEGIDVSGFTGIMPLRSLNKSKFLQTYGRSARLDKDDRVALDKGLITPNDLDMMNKPYAYIIIPNVIHSNEDDKANLTRIITELRSYDYKPHELIVSSTMVNGIPDIVEPNGLNDLIRRIPNVGELIENLEKEIENESDAKLSPMEFFEKTFGE